MRLLKMFKGLIVLYVIVTASLLFLSFMGGSSLFYSADFFALSFCFNLGKGLRDKKNKERNYFCQDSRSSIMISLLCPSISDSPIKSPTAAGFDADSLPWDPAVLFTNSDSKRNKTQIHRLRTSRHSIVNTPPSYSSIWMFDTSLSIQVVRSKKSRITAMT